MINKILIVVVVFSVFISWGLFVSKVTARDDTGSSSGELEEITENVKKRIQEVIHEQENIKNQEVIYGKLNSITQNTLSITQDNDGVKLASTSAGTTFVRIPGNTKLNQDDLAIDEYVIIVGSTNNNDVINADKVVSQKTPPVLPIQKTFYGRIYTYNPKEYLLTVTNPQTDQKQDFTLGRKSNIYLGNPDGTKTKIDRKQNLPVQSQILILYSPTEDPEASPLVQEILIIPSSPLITPAELKP